MEEDYIEGLDPERTLSTRVKSIIVVRHAESVANTEGIYQGQTYDTDLSELGKKQTKALANRLNDLELRKIITSPLKRTYKTAEAVASEIGCDVEINEMIIETNHGVWEGKPKSWITQNFPDIHELWQRKPSEVIFPEG